MVLSDLLTRLRKEGFSNVPPAKIHYAVRAGHIDRPRLNGALVFDFDDENFRQIVDYLKQPRQRGRKRTQTSEARA